MEDNLTINDLVKRWEDALAHTQDAVRKNPENYRKVKSLAGAIVSKPIDINEYMPTAEKLANLLKAMDPSGKGSIFFHFSDRILPNSIWQVPLLRVECKDLLEHLDAFDTWRMETHCIKVIK